jgi:hypothetical protein
MSPPPPAPDSTPLEAAAPPPEEEDEAVTVEVEVAVSEVSSFLQPATMAITQTIPNRFFDIVFTFISQKMA